MSRKWAKTAASLLILLVLVTTLGLGCGKGDGGGSVTIVIGWMTDLSGPSAPAMVPLAWATDDLIKHINEEDPIPGAKLKVVTYDTAYNPARVIPGFDWLIEKGAKLVLDPYVDQVEALKPFAERARVPILAFSPSKASCEPPGWVFGVHYYEADGIKTFMKWVEDTWPNYPTKPKIGQVGWSDGYGVNLASAAKEYMQAHPDKFEYVGSYLEPQGTMSFAGVVSRLQDCDYIQLCGAGATVTSSAIRDSRTRGYEGKYFGGENPPAFYGYLVDSCDWEFLDGLYAVMGWVFWNDSQPVVETMTQLLYDSHPGEAKEAIHAGSGYVGGGTQMMFIFEMLRAAITKVGAENFNGQAFYDNSVNFQTTWEGFPELSFTENRRYCVTHVRIREYRADAEAMVAVTDWLPIVVE